MNGLITVLLNLNDIYFLYREEIKKIYEIKKKFFHV